MAENIEKNEWKVFRQKMLQCTDPIQLGLLKEELGDSLARNCQALVSFVLNKHFPNFKLKGQNRDEVCSIAGMAIAIGISHYDPSKAEVSTYFINQIKYAISAWIHSEQKDTTNLSRTISQNKAEMERLEAEYYALRLNGKLNEDVTLENYLDEHGITERKRKNIEQNRVEIISYDNIYSENASANIDANLIAETTPTDHIQLLEAFQQLCFTEEEIAFESEKLCTDHSPKYRSKLLSRIERRQEYLIKTLNRLKIDSDTLDTETLRKLMESIYGFYSAN